MTYRIRVVGPAGYEQYINNDRAIPLTSHNDATVFDTFEAADYVLVTIPRCFLHNTVIDVVNDEGE